ncbi:MAG: GNAT family N-acetyltransferase [Gemmatimonadetes bacterium]|nr:GNAT family N-acetyltransferase [Gemmatimonadota bacterium]
MPSGELDIRPYTAADDAEALALDRACMQGTAYRLSFERPTFRRRAENFDDWAIFAGWLRGRIVALAGIATKPATLFGVPTTVAFGFDLRVHPDFRGRGLAGRMAGVAADWAWERSDLVYSWVAEDNRVSGAVLKRLHGRPLAAFRYLVYPTHRRLAPEREVRSASPEEVYARHVRRAGPFDLLTSPQVATMPGHVRSWTVRAGGELAACSAWDNSGILAEVVESLPRGLALAGAAFGTWPLTRARLPRIPGPGERIRSWYLHDVVATRPALGRDLVRHVAAEARERDIDFLYIAHPPSQAAWIQRVRKDHPRFFAPVLAYRMWGALKDDPGARLAAYVDIRDL